MAYRENQPLAESRITRLALLLYLASGGVGLFLVAWLLVWLVLDLLRQSSAPSVSFPPLIPWLPLVCGAMIVSKLALRRMLRGDGEEHR